MSRSSRNPLFLIILLIILVVVAVPQQTTPAPETPSTPQTQPGPASQGTASVLKVMTRLVVVDVIVLDHKGVPVTDLKTEDFSLREEGAEQKIRVFNFQQSTQSQGQPATLVAATLPPRRITNMPRFKTNSTLNVLLLDGINVTSQNQKYAREQMLKFLEKLPAGQPLAVYALGPKLRMLQDFTTDPALLREAVKKARDNAMGVRSETSNAADLPAGMLEQMPDAMLQSILRFGQDQAINQLDERVNLTLTQLSALAGNLAGYPGRKNLIWLSESFPAYFVPSNPTIGTSNGVPSTIQPLIKSYQTQIDHAADLLSNAQVAVYPVDAATLSNRDAYSSLSNTDSNGQYLGRSARGAGRVGQR